MGIREAASQEEIKQAYREQVKKYHPDKYGDNPLRELAEEKLREINEAYEYLSKNQGQNYGSGYRSSENYSGSSAYGENSSFQRVREHIMRNDLRAAEEELNSIGSRSAEWFFLRGVISMKKGWYNQGYEDLNRAVNMDSSNFEYRETLNRFLNSNRSYSNQSYSRRGGANDDLCQTCTCLCCADQMCECCGGDLISCC